MNRTRLLLCAAPLVLVACASVSDRNRNTIATLREAHIEIKKEKIEGGLEKAMQSYQRFLEEAPDSALAPEAMRRLADLKIENEYGTITEGTGSAEKAKASTAPKGETRPAAASAAGAPSEQASAQISVHKESETDFERRTTRWRPVDNVATAAGGSAGGAGDLERMSARQAIALYRKLLDEYPDYKHNDQVLYQMSRAYEELGEVEKAMAVMEQMVRDCPQSRYFDEVQFRRAEHFFAHRRYLDAENAYASIVDRGAVSQFYELALYKLGWTYYKQELYEEAVHRFIALMDHKVSVGYDFAQTEDEQERKRTDDTFRVISLCFSNLGGADAAVAYFSRHGKRSYEDSVYSNLGEFYFNKRRYADAAAAYNAFVDRNPFHKAAPNFRMRVIEIQAAGGFPSLVLESKKKFAAAYGLDAEYWKHFDPSERPDVLGFLKTNLTDLAKHYHACYQDPKQAKDKAANFEEALHWYREFLASFPADSESPDVNYELAGLLLENRSFGEAAVEFEKTAYGYPSHAKSSQAGFEAVAAYREQLAAAPKDKDVVKREVVRSSLTFADTFPEHEKAAIVLGAATDDLYDMKEYEQALGAGKKLIEAFPGADADVVREAWLVVGHSSYELSRYSEAEGAYRKVLSSLPAKDKTRDTLVNNLAASIYKQGEQARAAQDYRTAADNFLRVGRVAPTSKIRPTAEYDAAAALIQLKDWEAAASVLAGFRKNFPDNPLQPEVTKKIAYVYKENNQLSLAADEYERIERESRDDEIRRDALLVAGELHEKVNNGARALQVYRRYVGYFPDPVEPNLEIRNKIAKILKAQNDRRSYLEELAKIVAIDASAGSARTPRTRYLAGSAALVLAEDAFDAFVAVNLVQPLDVNLKKKRELMKTATQKFSQLVDYEIGEMTAAATFYLAEIYANFSKALMASERPEGLNPAEREQYELAIEEQAYPFEEKAIQVHESNLKLISRGVYNAWIKKSLQKLAESVPARYARPEEASAILSSPDTYVFAIDRPAPAGSHVAKTEASDNTAPAQGEDPGSVAKADTAVPARAEPSGAAAQSDNTAPAQATEPGLVTESGTAVPAQAEQSGAVMQSDNTAPAQAEEPGLVTESGTAVPAQAEPSGAAAQSDNTVPAIVDSAGQPPVETGGATRR